MNDEWETPLDLFDTLNEEFDFKVDLCANNSNKKCHVYTDDVQEYYNNGGYNLFESFWMNPPYSRVNIDKCMETAYQISTNGKTVVCLVRFDPSAKWFQEWVDFKAAEVRMLNRRVKFQGAASAYNFPCCVVVYNGLWLSDTEYKIWGWK